MKPAQILFIVATIAPAAGCGTSVNEHFSSPRLTTPEIDYFDAPRSSLSPGNSGEVIGETSGTLWRSGPASLFGDRRARKAGDIVTIVVEIDDEAELRNRTETQRDASEELSVPALLGLNTLAQRVLPGGAGIDTAIDASTQSETNGDGAIRRRERITLRLAATVTHVLPNGNLLVSGSQEVRVNNELRDLQVDGVLRPEDISRTNVITYDKIAEARIFYGGKGDVSRVNRTRYGQKIIDLVSPF